jgi:hypothetical protein
MTDTTAYPHQEITLDQQVALRTAANGLAEEFDGVYGTETIERFLHSSPAERTGPPTTPPASTWPACGRSATTSNAGSVGRSTS